MIPWQPHRYSNRRCRYNNKPFSTETSTINNMKRIRPTYSIRCSTNSLIILLLKIIICSFGTVVVVVVGYPTGAGSCASGKNAVGGYHLEEQSPSGGKRTVLSGELSEGSVSVLINNNDDDPLMDVSQPYPLQTQIEYTITVVTTQDPGFKGILLRFSNTDNTMDVPNDIILQPSDTLLQLAMICLETESNTIGLTHTDNIEKLSVSALIQFNTPGTVLLDISIVGANDDTVSVYGHSAFTLEITGDPLTMIPTMSPMKIPTSLPPGVTAIPTVSPTISDFITETLSPTYTIVRASNNSQSSNNNTPTSMIKSSSSSSLLTFSSLTRHTILKGFYIWALQGVVALATAVIT